MHLFLQRRARHNFLKSLIFLRKTEQKGFYRDLQFNHLLGDSCINLTLCYADMRAGIREDADLKHGNCCEDAVHGWAVLKIVVVLNGWVQI